MKLLYEISFGFVLYRPNFAPVHIHFFSRVPAQDFTCTRTTPAWIDDGFACTNAASASVMYTSCLCAVADICCTLLRRCCNALSHEQGRPARAQPGVAHQQTTKICLLLCMLALCRRLASRALQLAPAIITSTERRHAYDGPGIPAPTRARAYMAALAGAAQSGCKSVSRLWFACGVPCASLPSVHTLLVAQHTLLPPDLEAPSGGDRAALHGAAWGN